MIRGKGPRATLVVAVLGGLALAVIAWLALRPDEPAIPGVPMGRILWSGAASDGDLSQYVVQACEPSRVSVVPDPLGNRRNALRVTVRDTDVKPCTPTENPRAQVLSPDLLRPGGEYWIGFSVLVPRSFPVSRGPGDNWMALHSVYGPPADGASSNAIAINTSPGVDSFYFRRSATYGFDQPWSMPIRRGRWVDFVVHLKLSRDPRAGFREQWVNVGDGWTRCRLSGQLRLHMRTLDRANGDGANVSKVGLYFRRGIVREGTVFFAAHKVGTGFGAVDPHTYGS